MKADEYMVAMQELVRLATNSNVSDNCKVVISDVVSSVSSLTEEIHEKVLELNLANKDEDLEQVAWCASCITELTSDFIVSTVSNVLVLGTSLDNGVSATALSSLQNKYESIYLEHEKLKKLYEPFDKTTKIVPEAIKYRIKYLKEEESLSFRKIADKLSAEGYSISHNTCSVYYRNITK